MKELELYIESEKIRRVRGVGRTWRLRESDYS
jgi:hypothetical protein